MKLLALRGSPTGRTAQVVAAAVTRLGLPCDVAVVADAPVLGQYDTVLLFTPTHGDEELQDAMETYLVGLPPGGHSYVVCELGNYYGYDEPGFGAARTVQRHLDGLGWRERFPPLSLDSLPEVDWPALEAWVDRLGAELEGAGRPA